MSVLLVLLNKVRKEKILTCCFLWSFSLMLLLPLLKNLWDSHGLSAWSSQTSFTRQQTRKFFTWTLSYGQNHIQQGELFEYMPQPHDYHWQSFWSRETLSISVLRVTFISWILPQCEDLFFFSEKWLSCWWSSFNGFDLLMLLDIENICSSFAQMKLNANKYLLKTLN